MKFRGLKNALYPLSLPLSSCEKHDGANFKIQVDLRRYIGVKLVNQEVCNVWIEKVSNGNNVQDYFVIAYRTMILTTL